MCNLMKVIDYELGRPRVRNIELLGISRANYYNLLHDRRNPSYEALKRLWEVAREELNWSAERFLEEILK